MTLVVDAAPLVALADAADRMHGPVHDALLSEPGPLVIPAPVSAEVDYLLGVRHGERARRSFLADLAAGRFAVDCLELDDYGLVADLDLRYEDLRLGLAESALVVAAHRHRTRRLLTFDERHFRAVTPVEGGAFTLLPFDV